MDIIFKEYENPHKTEILPLTTEVFRSDEIMDEVTIMDKTRVSNKKNGIDTILWIWAIGFAVFSPLGGVLNDYIPKCSVFALGFLGLFMLSMLCKIVLQKQFWMCVRKNKLLCMLIVLICTITGAKYGIDISQGIQGTFFSYFQIPSYLIGAFSLSLWLQEGRGRRYVLMQVYGVIFCFTFMVCQDRYIMDLGGFIRAVGMYSNPNEMSVYAFCALGFSVCLILEEKYSVFVNVLLASISMCALILGQSRAGLGSVVLLVAVIVVVYVVCMFRTSKKENVIKQSWARVCVLLFLFVLLTVGLYRILPPSLLEVTDIRGMYYTYTGRVELIKAYPELKQPLEEMLVYMEPPSVEEDYFKSTISTEPSLPNLDASTENLEDVLETTESDSTAEVPLYHHSPTESTTNMESQNNFVKKILQRLVSGNGTETSGIFNNMRFKIWSQYLVNLDKGWLIGAENGFASVMPEINGKTRACHNTFLYMLVQYGGIVFLMCGSVYVKLCVKSLIKCKVNLYKSSYCGMLIGLLPLLLLNDLVAVPTFWLALAVLGDATDAMDRKHTKSVVLVREYTGMGGVETQILNIAKGLKERGVQVHLISNQTSELSERMEQFGVHTQMIPMGNPFWAGLHVALYCGKHQADILQSHMFYESSICRVARLFCSNIKHVFRVHTYIDCAHIPEKKKKLYHALAFLTDSKVDMYLPINECNRREMLERSHIPTRKILVLHDAVNQLGDYFEELPTQKNRIAMIANFVRFKGHDTLVEGVEILRSRGIVLDTYLYGTCPVDEHGNPDTVVLEEVKTLIKLKGLEKQIHLCGYSTDIRQSLEGIWALVLPSDSEGTPNCVLEAMSLKVLTICSYVGGVPEFVIEGITGYCHEPKNAHAFADAIERAWKAPVETNDRIRTAAYHMWQKEYSMEGMMGVLENSYESLLTE